MTVGVANNVWRQESELPLAEAVAKGENLTMTQFIPPKGKESIHKETEEFLINQMHHVGVPKDNLEEEKLRLIRGITSLKKENQCLILTSPQTEN